MRVAQVSALFAPEFRGGATLVCERIATELVSRGHAAEVFSGRTTAAEPLGATRHDRIAGVATWRVNVGGALLPWTPESYTNPVATRSFADFLDATRPDIVHAHSLQGLGAGLMAAAAAARIPVVLTMHDWWWLCPCLFRLSPSGGICPEPVRPESCAGLPSYDFARRRRVLAAALEHVARVLTPSEFLRASLIENGFDAARIAVQENGVPPPREALLRPDANASGANDRRGRERGLRVVYIGGAGNREKGLEVLLEAGARAVATAAAGARPLELVCYSVSDAEAAPWAGRLAGSLSCRSAFASEDLDDVLSGADVLAIPSLMRESFSLVAREARARGVPVLTSDCGGPEEVVRDGESGLVVASGSADALATALRRLCDQEGLLERLRDGAPARFPTPADQARECESLYRDVLRERSRPVSARARACLGGRSVLFLTGIDGAPLRYRVWNLAERLADAGVESRVLYHSDVRARAAARAADCIVLFRAPYSAVVAGVVAEARGRGVPVVFSVDDLVFRSDTGRDAAGFAHTHAGHAAGFRDSVAAYELSCSVADDFLGSTETLVESAAEIGVPGFMVRNRLGRAQVAAIERARAQSCGRTTDEIRLGFLSGTDTHDRDLAVIADPLAAVLERHPNVRLVLGGPVAIPAALASRRDRIEHFSRVPWSELPARVATLAVNLAPLVLPGEFNQAKSEVKYIEAGALAVPTIASPSAAFRFATFDGATGALAADASEWEAALEALVADEYVRRELGEAARRDVLRRYSPGTPADDLLAALLEIVSSGTRAHGALPPALDMEAGTGSCVALEPGDAPYDAYQLDAESGGGLRPGAEVEQRIACRGDGVYRIDVMVGTYARRNDHEVELSVRDDAGRSLAHRRIAAAQLVDRSFVAIELDEPLASSAGRTLTVSAAAPQAGPGNEILLWHAPSEYGGLAIGGREVPGRALAFRVFGSVAA